MKGFIPRGASTEEKQKAFIKAAREIHGSRYDYSRVRYKNSGEKVKIVCKKHGPFPQTPDNHLWRKSGCPDCASEKRGKERRERFAKTFIKRAKEKHGSKYDYSKTKYFKTDEPVTITCPTHGDFPITPHEHLGGAGCQTCGHKQKNRQRKLAAGASFVPRAKKIHGQRYDYSRVQYEGMDRHVSVGCRRRGHGFFPITPGNHLSGGGCPKCKADKTRKIHRYTKSEFVRLARKVHGDTYTYPGKYVNGKTPMQMRCPKHGLFPQKPNSHLNGRGCRKCGDERTYAALFDSHEDFIKKARAVHGSKYTYPEKYERASKVITIICPKHGPFPQKPASHTAGHGCERCSESWGEREVARILEREGIEFEVEKRFKECRDKLPLSFDFWIPALNTLVEYDGEQHFRTNAFFGGVERLKLTQRRDKIKSRYARRTGKKLIRIKYTITEIKAYLLARLER
jgi:hypothetical protein